MFIVVFIVVFIVGWFVESFADCCWGNIQEICTRIRISIKILLALYLIRQIE